MSSDDESSEAVILEQRHLLDISQQIIRQMDILHEFNRQQNLEDRQQYLENNNDTLPLGFFSSEASSEDADGVGVQVTPGTQDLFLQTSDVINELIYNIQHKIKNSAKQQPLLDDFLPIQYNEKISRNEDFKKLYEKFQVDDIYIGGKSD